MAGNINADAESEDKMKAITYCDFGNYGRPNRQDIQGSHRTLQAARQQFKRIARIYHGIHGWRVWTVASNGRIICDTNLSHL